MKSWPMPPQQKKCRRKNASPPGRPLRQANSSENNLPIILPAFANVKGYRARRKKCAVPGMESVEGKCPNVNKLDYLKSSRAHFTRTKATWRKADTSTYFGLTTYDKNMTAMIDDETHLLEVSEREALVLCLTLGTLEAMRGGLWPLEAGIWTLGRPIFVGAACRG